MKDHRPLFAAKAAPFPGQPSPGGGGRHHAYIIVLDDDEPWLAHFRTHDVPTRQMAHALVREVLAERAHARRQLELTRGKKG